MTYFWMSVVVAASLMIGFFVARDMYFPYKQKAVQMEDTIKGLIAQVDSAEKSLESQCQEVIKLHNENINLKQVAAVLKKEPEEKKKKGARGGWTSAKAQLES